MIALVPKARWFICLFLAIVFALPTYGQGCIDQNHGSNRKSLSFEYREQDWRAVEREWISIRVPREMLEYGKRCIDGHCLRYKGPSAYLNIDRSSDAFGPSFERHFETYESKSICIGGEMALMWQYKQDTEFRNVFGVLFQVSDSEQIVVTYVSKSESDSLVAERIFHSIRFNQR